MADAAPCLSEEQTVTSLIHYRLRVNQPRPAGWPCHRDHRKRKMRLPTGIGAHPATTSGGTATRGRAPTYRDRHRPVRSHASRDHYPSSHLTHGPAIRMMQITTTHHEVLDLKTRIPAIVTRGSMNLVSEKNLGISWGIHAPWKATVSLRWHTPLVSFLECNPQYDDYRRPPNQSVFQRCSSSDGSLKQ